MVEKTLRGWVGFTNWGVRLFICGGTALKGGSLSELPETAFFNTFLIRNRSFGGWINYLRLAWQACTWGHPITFVFCVAGVALLALLKNRVAGVALGGIHHRFAWQAWRLGTSNYLRFAWQACTWGHPITFVFCVAGVALLALLKNPCFMCARAFRPQPFWFIIYGEYCAVYFEVIHGKCAWSAWSVHEQLGQQLGFNWLAWFLEWDSSCSSAAVLVHSGGHGLTVKTSWNPPDPIGISQDLIQLKPHETHQIPLGFHKIWYS